MERDLFSGQTRIAIFTWSPSEVDEERHDDRQMSPFGLLLAAVGLYGITAFTVTRRLREFGIRIALGAERRNILGLVLQHGLGLVTIGCTLGVLLAAGAAHVLTAFLVGVPPLDPAAFAVAVLSFVAVGLAACYSAARRATGVAPVSALRCD